MSLSEPFVAALQPPPHALSAAALQHRLEHLELIHGEFMSRWRQALTASVPANIKLRMGSVHVRPYKEYILSAPAVADIQIYEVETLQTLCAFSLDVLGVPTLVDCMFGGSGRIPVRQTQRRPTHIELGVRHRVFESLAQAYAQAWAAYAPVVLKPLRQEQQLSSLRLTSPQELVIHAQMRLHINEALMALDFCMPARALSALDEPAAQASSPTAAPAANWEASLQDGLHSAQTELVAVLAEKQMTVAQLLSLSIGQVIPMDLLDPVQVKSSGVTVVEGRYGVRNGRYALKVERLKTAAATAASPQESDGAAALDAQLTEAVPPRVELPGASELASALASISPPTTPTASATPGVSAP